MTDHPDDNDINSHRRAVSELDPIEVDEETNAAEDHDEIPGEC